DAEQIIFAPDQHLAAYCQRFTSKQIIPWKGLCYVHSRFSVQEVMKAKSALPDALLLVHPECPGAVIDLADKVLSTNQMIQFVASSPVTTFLIATEEGIIHRLRRENPGKLFYAAGVAKTCYNMKKTTLQDIYYSLLKGRTAIELPEQVMNDARRSLKAMLSYV
ncbi:MAG: quinolinate synthase NadA, partial [Candidatus Margulisiibacteriota bacterium]